MLEIVKYLERRNHWNSYSLCCFSWIFCI